MKYEGTNIVCAGKGSSFEEFRDSFGEVERGFGYIRLQVTFKNLFPYLIY